LTKIRFEHARRVVARTLLLCAVALLLGAAIACPYAGHFLIVDEPLEPADAILVLAGSRTVRWLEGVDLYRERMAPNVVISPGIVESAEVELRRRGIDFPAEADLVKRAMVQLGVPGPAITILSSTGRLDNTADEAAAMKQLAVQRDWASVIVVTSKYHTRRTRFAFRREFSDTSIRIQVRGSRYDGAKPDGWWRSRPDLRYVISELQKLLAYRLGIDR
jgi:uncharacterized SAM-binding protein YcdF (DUF218 family)